MSAHQRAMIMPARLPRTAGLDEDALPPMAESLPVRLIRFPETPMGRVPPGLRPRRGPPRPDGREPAGAADAFPRDPDGAHPPGAARPRHDRTAMAGAVHRARPQGNRDHRPGRTGVPAAAQPVAHPARPGGAGPDDPARLADGPAPRTGFGGSGWRGADPPGRAG